jgi:hypothetical protein
MKFRSLPRLRLKQKFPTSTANVGYLYRSGRAKIETTHSELENDAACDLRTRGGVRLWNLVFEQRGTCVTKLNAGIVSVGRSLVNWGE